MEWLTQKIEKLMENKKAAIIMGIIAVLAPLYFLKTLHMGWFGPEEIRYGFKTQWSTWLVLTFVDFVGFLTTLPARKQNRVMQIVMALWTVEMFLFFLATVIR